ncbi:MAG: hypothetical protein SGI87_05525 [Flavobacteriales bacterium]|nr:hypothetical protein [Flavobacteriales bacterium]
MSSNNRNENKENSGLLLAIGLIGLAAATIFILWRVTLKWAHNSLIPWIRIKNLPKLGQIVEDALVFFDKARSVASDFVRRAWEAWNKFRVLLVKQVMRFNKKQGTMQIVSSVENWVREPQDTNVISHQIVEADVEWNDLPPDIRIAIIENGQHEVDVVTAREAEFAEMGYVN